MKKTSLLVLFLLFTNPLYGQEFREWSFGSKNGGVLMMHDTFDDGFYKIGAFMLGSGDDEHAIGLLCEGTPDLQARLYITDHNKFFDNPNYTAQWRMHAGYGQPEVEPTPVDMSVVWTRIEPNSDNYKTAIRIHWPGNPIEYLLDRNEQYNKVSGWGPLMTKYEWLVFHIDIIDSTNNTVVYPALFSLPYIWETERELANLGCGV